MPNMKSIDLSAAYNAIKSVWIDNTDYVQSISHWRGAKNWEDNEKWLNIGRSCLKKVNHIELLTQDLSKLTSPPSNEHKYNILEWGPGGGGNVYALLTKAKRYYGVDISGDNLQETASVAAQEGFFNFKPIHIQEDPKKALEAIHDPIDLFISTAVFQHFPSKEYGAVVLDVIRSACRKGAIGVIQIRFDNGNTKYEGIKKLSNYKTKHITANSYAIDEFWALCTQSNFRVLSITNLNKDINYIDFNLMAI